MTRLTATLCALFTMFTVASVTPASAGPDQEELVEEARFTLQRVARHADIGPTVRDLLKEAREAQKRSDGEASS